jgi:hypothetical protein
VPSPVGIDAVQYRVQRVYADVLGIEVVQATAVTLDLGRPFLNLRLELIDDLPSAIVEWNQSDYGRHRLES